MKDIRARKFAQIMVDHSTRVRPGDRVAVTATTAVEPILLALYELILERGGYPHFLIDLPSQEELLFAHASNEQLEFVPLFHQSAFGEFDVLIKIRSELNTRSLSSVPPKRLSHRQKATASLIKKQMQRGAEGSLRWLSTQYPTPAYAMEADMGFEEYSDFFFRACHADEDTPDPVAHWQGIEREQKHIIDAIQGHNQVTVRGPNADLNLSILGRKFNNACGQRNLPDGEIFTGPVENSVNGWVRFSYPAIYQGRVVEGIELKFVDGRVIEASATKNQDVLLNMLDIDAGARYVGEFAIGTNFEINRFTHSILLDEKIGGSFHMALGAGYPETGSLNKSLIHWDMICDLRQDSEIIVDGETFYRNGEFMI
ncbi:MAG: aminopeptidase [Anaerolineales bacterium]|nr:MAG: aminopeptidase [Anaerolineales bacterium]